MKDNRTYKSGAKSIIMNNNCSLDLNRSMTNSIITSSYIILKDGTKKRKRHVNSYMEEFLEKRRMAAEFAQSKRSTSSKNPKVRVNKNMSSSNDYKYNINIKKIEEAISINNLKNNLPGKTTALIDNTNFQNNNAILEKNETDNKGNMLFQDNSNKYSKYINVSNKEEVNKVSDTKSLIINNQNINNNFYINEQNNYNISNANSNNDKDYLEKKYNNIQRRNIVYTKKKENSNNKNLSNHSFTENRYSSMYQDNDIDEQCNMGNMDLLGPQLPEEAFLGNDKNNKYAISKDININYENNIQNTDKKSLSKDIKDNKNFKDISPIKPNINIHSQNNSGNIYSLNEEDADIDIDNANIKKVNKSEHFISLMQRMINKNNTNENDPYALNLKNKEEQKDNIENNKNNILDKQNEIANNKKNEILNYNNEQNINVNIENNINIKNIKNIEYKKFINKTEELKVEENMIDTQKKVEQNSSNYQEQFNLKEKNVKNIILNEEDNLNNSDENEQIDTQNIKNDKNDSNNNENNLEVSQNNKNNQKNESINNKNNNEKMIEDNKNENENDNDKEDDNENENNNIRDIKGNENINNNIQNYQNKDTFDIIDNEKDEKRNNALLKSDKLTKNNSISENQNSNLNSNMNKMNLMNSEEQKFLEEYVVEENEENNVVITKEEEENDEQEKSINKQDEEKNENYNDEEENDDIERCEVLKGDELRDKSKYLKGKNNIITEEIEEVEEAQEANENTSEFANSKSNRKHMYTPMIITQNNFEIKNNSNKEDIKSKNDVKDFSISNQNIFIPQQKENKKEQEKEKEENKDVKDYIVNQKRNINFNKIINDDNVKYNNLSKVEIIDFKGNKNEQIYYKKNINYIDKNKLNELNEQNNENEKVNMGNDMNIDMITNKNAIKYKNSESNYSYNINNYQNDENKEIYKSNNIDIFNNINNLKKDTKEGNNQNKANTLFNDDNTNDMNSINKISNITNNNINLNTDISNNDNNDNYSNNNYINNTVNNIEKETQINSKEKEEFLKVINQDIERLEKIRNNNMPQETKEEDSYMYEIDNFINLMKEKRKSTESNAIKELMDIKDEYNSQQKYNFYEIKKNLNANNDYSNINDISDNKVKLNINKSSRLQTLLNNLKKEKISDKFKYDIFNNSNEYNKENMGEISYNLYNEKNNENEDENNDFDGGKKDKLFDETMFRKIKERNFNNKNNYRKEFQLKDYGTNKNHSHVYLDKVKEDLMNISSTKIMSKNELNKKRIPMSRLVYPNTNINANNNDIDIEIMPANNMSSLYKKNFK